MLRLQIMKRKQKEYSKKIVCYFRLKICSKICTPHRDSMPAHRITTYSSKRSIQRKMEKMDDLHTKPSQYERKARVTIDRLNRWTTSDKARMAKRHSLKTACYIGPINERVNGLWNRDINAARNIAYLGLCRYGQYIDAELDIEENTAFSRRSSS